MAAILSAHPICGVLCI